MKPIDTRLSLFLESDERVVFFFTTWRFILRPSGIILLFLFPCECVCIWGVLYEIKLKELGKA